MTQLLQAKCGWTLENPGPLFPDLQSHTGTKIFLALARMNCGGKKRGKATSRTTQGHGFMVFSTTPQKKPNDSKVVRVLKQAMLSVPRLRTNLYTIGPLSMKCSQSPLSHQDDNQKNIYITICIVQKVTKVYCQMKTPGPGILLSWQSPGFGLQHHMKV